MLTPSHLSAIILLFLLKLKAC